jgi:hypothetical protein
MLGKQRLRDGVYPCFASYMKAAHVPACATQPLVFGRLDMLQGAVQLGQSDVHRLAERRSRCRLSTCACCSE